MGVLHALAQIEKNKAGFLAVQKRVFQCTEEKAKQSLLTDYVMHTLVDQDYAYRDSSAIGPTMPVIKSTSSHHVMLHFGVDGEAQVRRRRGV